MGRGGQAGFAQAEGRWRAILQGQMYGAGKEKVYVGGQEWDTRSSVYESLRDQSRPQEAPGPASGAVPQPARSPARVIPEQEQKEEVV